MVLMIIEHFKENYIWNSAYICSIWRNNSCSISNSKGTLGLDETTAQANKCQLLASGL